MAKRKTDAEKLAELELKEAQLKKQKQLLKNKLNAQERKARTRQMIQIGALASKILNIDYKEDISEIENKLIKIANQINNSHEE